MKKQVIMGIIAMITIALIIIALVFQAPKTNNVNPDFAPYISAYTEGTISKTSTIKVVLNSIVADSIDNKKIDANKLFVIYPKIEGTAKFVDNRTIEFSPEKPLSSGNDYVIKFKLKKIIDVPNSLKHFIFPIHVVNQDLKLSIEDQITTDRKTLKYQQVTGSVRTADIENLELIKQAITAKYNSKPTPIEWRQTELSNIFYFKIDSIQRGDSSQTLVLQYNGKFIGSKTQGEKKIKIPALNEFAISSIRVYDVPSQHIKIQLTDPVNTTQELLGLVTVAENERINSDYKIELADNCINIYPPSPRTGKAKVFISSGIKNILDNTLGTDKEFDIDFEMQKPQLRSVKTGLILPDGDDGLVYPFEAINLTAVDVTIIKVLEKNILSYIRDYSNYYNGDNLEKTGIPVFRKTIHINSAENEDVTTWKRYYLELSKLIKTEPGAIYNINISFRKSHAYINCDNCENGDDCSDEKDIDISDFDSQSKYYYSSINNKYYTENGYNWQNSDNPCYKMYYQTDRFISQSILASNLGIIAKKGSDNSLQVYVTNLKTAQPDPGAAVEVYGYQQQLLASKNVDKDGKAEFGILPKSYFVVARHGNEANYLVVENYNGLNLSKFDISGQEVKNGLQGYIYGERGVWRPGDTLHLSFILKEDPNNPLPNGYPITMKVQNAQYQDIYQETVKKNPSNFYVFHVKTNENDATGTYKATVTCGNVSFNKRLRIETVLPNRLKINTKFNKETFTAKDNIMEIQSMWLHGAVARNLKYDVKWNMKPRTLKFDQWEDYQFNNSTPDSYNSYDYEHVSEGTLDENGKAEIEYSFDPIYTKYPAKMRTYFKVRIFEKGGRYTQDEFSIDVIPYTNYLGIKMPKSENHFLEVDKQHDVDFVFVDHQGKIVKGKRNLDIKLYKMEWQWWFDSHNYVSKYNSTLLQNDTIQIDGTGKYSFNIKYPDWGRYLLEASDIETGIKTSYVFYMDWPNSYGRSPILSQGSTIVELTTDKQKYTVGEMVKLSIPTSGNGKALVTIENGTKVIQNIWLTTKENKTEYTFKVMPDMEPGIYIFVTLLQPHSQTINDMPIRMYGVLPIDVENPATILQPEISMPDVITADEEVKITVSEKNNKNMTYTIALVDDGLLDLTHYKTPDPWQQFYSREALGVNTIDMYDNVIGAFSGKIEKLFTIGGDDANVAGSKKANNFESVVAFLGPFTTNGQKMTHKIKMPKYIGSVRTMLIAGNGKAYGKAEKTCTVTKPLMAFATTPRIIGTQEKFQLPITIFSGDKSIKQVTVKVKASNGLTINGKSSETLQFNGQSELNPMFEIVSDNQAGIGTIEISAISGNYTSNLDLKMEIREPNNKQQQTISKVIPKGGTVEIEFQPIGRNNTNTATINVNGLLPLNYEGHINNILEHTYINLNNLVSRAFPMLYENKITELSSQTKERDENIIRESIKEIYSYQNATGGVSCWRNGSYVDVDATSYAGQFMIEAQKAGYSVNPEFITKWKKFQKMKAEAWTPDSRLSYESQAYRLYTMALAGEPLTGSMNRLKEYKNLTFETRIYLALAYLTAGKKQTAESIINVKKEPFFTTPTALIYLCELNDENEAYNLAKNIVEEIEKKDYFYWLSCKYESLSLVAIGKYYAKFKPAANTIKCKYEINNKSHEIITDKSFATNTLEINNIDKQKIRFTNNSEGNLYVEITNSGIPEAGKELSENYGITAELKFYQGKEEISPKTLKQGTDFTAVIKVKNVSETYIDKLGITEMFPTGWEIINGASYFNSADNDDYDEDYYDYYDSYSYNYRKGTVLYTDVRDDRKITYFSLPSKGEMEFRTNLTATYAGEYYLPGLNCINLDDPKIFVKTKGMMVKVEAEK